MRKRKWINVSLVLIMLFSIINPFASLNVYATEEQPTDTQAVQTDLTATENTQSDNNQYENVSSEKVVVHTSNESYNSIDFSWYIENQSSTFVSYEIYLNNELKATVSETQMYYYLDGLQPGTDYELQIIAHTADGYSIESPPTPFTTVRNDSVETSIQIVTDKGNVPDSNLHLMINDDETGSIFYSGWPDREGFFVEYDNPSRVLKLVPGTYELEIQHSYSGETIYVPFVVENGLDYVTNPITIEVEDVKVQSPKHLNIVSGSESTVTVEWFQYIIHDEVEKYNVYLDDELVTVIEDIYTSEYIYTGLQPETDYMFKIEIVKHDGSVVTVQNSATTGQGPTGIEIPFKDEHLKQAIKNELGIVDREVRESDMVDLYWLNIWSEDVTDLSGLEYAKNLQDLSVNYTGVKDLTPISTLQYIESLNVSYNKITDLKPLENLRNLKYVSVVGNETEYSKENMAVISALITKGVEVSWLESWESQLVITDLTDSQVSFTVDFPKVKDMALNYDVYFQGEKVGELLPESTYTIDNLDENSSYEISVKAVDENGNTWATAFEYVLTKTPPSGDVVKIVDPALEQVIREFLKVQSRELYASDLEELEYLYAYDRDIQDLTGLEYAVNLAELHLGKNSVTNFEALSNLKNLNWLNVTYNNLTSLEEFIQIPNLKMLDVSNNKISDLTALLQMKTLTGVALNGNGLTDISLLAEMPNLITVSVSDNELTDISSLSTLSKIRDINISNNKITDISVLLDLDRLYYAAVNNNSLDLSEGSKDMKVIEELENKLSIFMYEKEPKNEIQVSLGQITKASIELDWSSVPENPYYVMVPLYDIFVNGKKVAVDLKDTHYVLEGLEQNTTYYIEVVFTETGDELFKGSIKATTQSDTPAEEPGEEQPPVEEPGEEQPPVEEPGEEQPPVKEPGEEQPPVEEPGEEQPPLEEPGEEQPPVEEPGEEQPPVEQPEYKNPVLTITKTKVTETEIQLSWNVENKESVSKYWVYVNGREYSTLDKNATEITIKNLEPNTFYKIIIEALTNGSSDISKVVETRTKAVQVVSTPVINNGTAKVPTTDIEKVKNGEKLVVNLEKAESAKVELTKDQVKTLKDKGADLVIGNQNVQLQIPLYNLPEDKVVETVVQKMKPVDGAASPVYDFTIYADGDAVHTFKVPITLVFEVDADKVSNPDNLKVFYFNEVTEEWELIPGAVYQDGKVSVETDHFSIFAVFEVANSEDKVVTETPEPENKLPQTELPGVDDNKPSTPVEENKTSEDTKTEKDSDNNTSEEDSEVSKEKSENQLPDTATNNYTLLLGGIILLAVGAALVLTRRRFAKR